MLLSVGLLTKLELDMLRVWRLNHGFTSVIRWHDRSNDAVVTSQALEFLAQLPEVVQDFLESAVIFLKHLSAVLFEVLLDISQAVVDFQNGGKNVQLAVDGEFTLLAAFLRVCSEMLFDELAVLVSQQEPSEELLGQYDSRRVVLFDHCIWHHFFTRVNVVGARWFRFLLTSHFFPKK